MKPVDEGSGLWSTRSREAGRLEQLLLQDQVPSVCLHGARGSGKSALATKFAESHPDAFPGGHPIIPGSQLSKTRYLAMLDEASRSLLVVDDADLAPIDALRWILRDLRQSRPRASVLMTSGLPILAGDHDTALVEMPPLNPSAIIEILRRSQPQGSADRLEAVIPLLEGNAAAAQLVSRRLAAGDPIERILEWLGSGRLATALDPSGHPLAEGSAEKQRLDLTVCEISDDLIRELSARPEQLYKLHPRRFEELIAALFERRGFEVSLTPASGDEGADVYVVGHSEMGRTLWVVQAKRNAPERKVEAGVVRELLGTVTAKNASAGLLVTTSFFQPGARELAQQFEYRLNLKDYLDLQAMLGGATLLG